MTTATVTSKGQIPIPVEVRPALQDDAGARVDFGQMEPVVELVWVLPSCYGLKRAQLAQALDAQLRAKQLVVDPSDQVARALRMFASGSAEFAECLIERTAAHAGCAETMTFDGAAAKTAGITLML